MNVSANVYTHAFYIASYKNNDFEIKSKWFYIINFIVSINFHIEKIIVL